MAGALRAQKFGPACHIGALVGPLSVVRSERGGGAVLASEVSGAVVDVAGEVSHRSRMRHLYQVKGQMRAGLPRNPRRAQTALSPDSYRCPAGRSVESRRGGGCEMAAEVNTETPVSETGLSPDPCRYQRGANGLAAYGWRRCAVHQAGCVGESFCRGAGSWSGVARQAGSGAVIAAHCVHGGAGWGPGFGEQNRASFAFQGLTTGLTRLVVPLPLPQRADLVSGVVRSRVLTGVEAK